MPISCSIAPIAKCMCLYVSTCGKIWAVSEFTSGGRHIGFQHGRHMFALLRNSLAIDLERKI